MRRRSMLTLAVAGGLRPAAAQPGSGRTVVEAQRRVPVAAETEVLVCGGGPAGLAAAITASRAGAKTMLIESRPFLGGTWTAVGITHYIDGRGKGGLNEEIHRRLPVYETWGRNIYPIEAMKCMLDDLITESTVRVQFHTFAAAVLREGRLIRGVFTESKSGREFIAVRVVIDCTGDGDIAAAAGCEYEKGRPGDGLLQPMTLFGRIGGYRGRPAKGKELLDICAKSGWQPTYTAITLFPQPGQPGIFTLMATHLYGDGTDVRQLTAAEKRGRWEVSKTVEALVRHGGADWKDAFLIDTGPFIGVRETRRIKGRYFLTAEDLKRGAQFEDAVCDVSFGVDIHEPDPQVSGGIHPVGFKSKPYQIPYRSLLAREVDNLLLAGRCISGDHVAHSSYRVTGNAVGMGEAAGLAAAMALSANELPANLDAAKLTGRLRQIRRPGARVPLSPQVTPD